MNAEVAYLPYNPAMLRWAREWRGRSIDEASLKMGVAPEKIYQWEAGEAKPTVAQARRLAASYDRPFLEFFYDEPPQINAPALVPDFRLHRGAAEPDGNRELLEIQHWAELQRINALELFEDLDEEPPQFPNDLRAALSDDVESAAVKARSVLDFPITRQQHLTYKEKQALPEMLRAKMEDAGVLMLRENEIAKHGVSGLCIVQFPLPIIVFSSESPGRSAFTLMHEFGHIVLRESAISGSERAAGGTGRARQIERWCDRFAAAFLIPRAALEELRARPTEPAPNFDDDVLRALASSFKVSPHAMLIRLVDLGFVDSDYYWRVKRPMFLAEERKWKSGGISTIWVSRIWNKVGRRYTGLVLEALGRGRIQFSQAQAYLGLKNPEHVNSIKREFRGY